MRKTQCLAIDEQCRFLPQDRKRGKKKVLLISYYFPPCVYGYAIRTYNFWKNMADFGWEPYVLTIDPVYYKEKGVESKHFSFESYANILRTGSLEPKKPIFQQSYQDKDNPQNTRTCGIPKKGLSVQLKYTMNHLLIPDNQVLWLPYAVLAGQKLILKENIDLIYVTSPPFSPLLVGYLLKKATGRPFLFEYRDTWQDNLDNRQGMSFFS